MSIAAPRALVRPLIYIGLGVIPAFAPAFLGLIFLPGWWKLVPVLGLWGLVAAAFLAPARVGPWQSLGVLFFLLCGLSLAGFGAVFYAGEIVRYRSVQFGQLAILLPSLCAIFYLAEVVAAAVQLSQFQAKNRARERSEGDGR